MTIRRLVDRRAGFFLLTKDETLACCSLCHWCIHGKHYEDASHSLNLHLLLAHHRSRKSTGEIVTRRRRVRAPSVE